MEEELPFTEIEKRDGRIVDFDAEKITQAIFKAARAVGGEDYQLAREVTREVVEYLAAQKLPGLHPTVEEIQDVVEKVLIERGHARTAKAYILYRDKRTRIRENKSELMDVVKEILLKNNAPPAAGGDSRHSPAGKMLQIAEAASTKYYLENLLPSEIAQAHREGSFHIHSLGYYSKALESLQIDLLQTPPETCISAKDSSLPLDPLGQLFGLAALLQSNQNDLVGEQALLSFDSFLGRLQRQNPESEGNEKLGSGTVEFVSYLDRLLHCSLKGAREMRCTLQLGVDCSEEGRALTRFLMEALKRGRKERRGGCELVFNVKEGINLTSADPNYDLFRLALETSLHCGTPAFSVQAGPGTPARGGGSYFSSGRKIGPNRHGQAGGHGRGEVASLTVNLPRLAFKTGKIDLFMVELDRLLRLSVRQLLHRFEVLTAICKEDLPYTMGRGVYEHSRVIAPGESVKKALKSGVMYIGFTGLQEASRLLAGGVKTDEANGDGIYLAAKIAEHMGRRVSSYADEYDLNIYLSGAVNHSGLFALTEKDRADFGTMKGVNDKDFYSTSFMLFQEDEGFEKKVELEGIIHGSCTGGYCSKALVLPGTDLASAEDMVRKMGAAGINFVRFSPVQ